MEEKSVTSSAKAITLMGMSPSGDEAMYGSGAVFTHSKSGFRKSVHLRGLDPGPRRGGYCSAYPVTCDDGTEASIVQPQ